MSSSALRLASFFAVLFLALTGTLILTVTWIVESTQRRVLQAANDADIVMIGNGYREEGVSEAVEVVRQRLSASSSTEFRPGDSYLLIQNAQGERLAGNMSAMAPRVGSFDLQLEPPGQAGAAVPAPDGDARVFGVRGRGELLGPDLYIFAGRDTRLVTATRARILSAFAWVAAGATVIAAAAGWFLGSRFMQRVDDIARTCESIIAGQLSGRIAPRGRGDEWDRLAGAINDMLNRISRLLDNLRQVSSDVAHDLRTPLTRLRNRLETAHTRCATVEEYSHAVAGALEDIDQVLAIFAALLRISQVEAGTRAATFADVSLSALAQTAFEMYRPVAEDYRHVLEAHIEPRVSVHGDAELLMQMFSNLIENSIRHTPDSSTIRIDVHSVRGAAMMTVQDNGGGIPADEYGKVTRRFYRLSNSRSAAGNGLGLALVAAIAELHHATLGFADAAPGLAVCVTFGAVAEPAA